MRIRRRLGFTLIEAMAVVSIIGILASLSIYVAAGVSMRSRDSRRKSDLAAISLGFQARYEAKTCSIPAEIGIYPGSKLNQTWNKVSDLATQPADSCGPFSEYLRTVPSNPNDSKSAYPYRFDLGANNKHFRLTAKLERALNTTAQAELDRAEDIWENSFEGARLPDGYNYLIGN